MNQIDIIALTKAIPSKAAAAAREETGPGTYPVDVTVRLSGTITVAPDTEKTPTVSIPLKEVLALFVARSGITRESSIKLLRECLADALRDGAGATGAVAAATDIDTVFSEAVSVLLADLPKTPVKGAVKSNLTVSVVTGG